MDIRERVNSLLEIRTGDPIEQVVANVWNGALFAVEREIDEHLGQYLGEVTGCAVTDRTDVFLDMLKGKADPDDRIVLYRLRRDPHTR